MSDKKPVKLAILWHLHQPNYQEPSSNRMVMPWVRLHAIKDYLDMPLIASKYENIKTTFNLVPSLLDQLDLYTQGGTDPHLQLSRINPENLSPDRKKEILKTFFTANNANMIEPYPRYFDLFKKAKNSLDLEILPALFSSEEIRDLQVWSNLCWIDPVFHHEEPVKTLLSRGRHFTEEQKHILLDWQIEIIKKIKPTFKDLFSIGKIDISFTPYFHPILPLLCDTDSAKEAMPNIKLPEKRFIHPEDARYQIVSSIQKYESIFGVPLKGMWPSEGSVSEEVARMLIESGIKWIATDEEILFCSLKKGHQAGLHYKLPAVYEYGPGLKILFRNHALSDKVGFVYSGWDADRAVNDFINSIKSIRRENLDNLDNTVVSVILDGENCWEFFPKDGQDFLDELYRRLNDDDEIETITMTEASESLESIKLNYLHAGSWINHNFKIWIGHHEDNCAWNILKNTRDQLVEFEKNNPGFDVDKLKKAWQQIYIAEGSDWCWWYGDEHRSVHNEQFDQIFRRHLIAVYELLNLETPFELLNPIYTSEKDYETQIPDSLISPDIDGRITHFYEWAGAGIYDNSRVGDSMHRVDRYTDKLFYGFDKDWLYIRLDFSDKNKLDLIKCLRLKLSFYNNEIKETIIDLSHKKVDNKTGSIIYVMNDVLEIAISRSNITKSGNGLVEFNVALMDNSNILEVIPLGKTIKIELPEKAEEYFWPL